MRRLQVALSALGLLIAGCTEGTTGPAEQPGDASTTPDAAVGPADGGPDAALPEPDALASAAPDAAVGPADAAPDAGLACSVHQMYDPVVGVALETFPDDYSTVDTPDTLTGLRPSMSAELAPWLPSIVGNYGDVFRQLQTLDGWGTTAGVILRFDGPVAVPEPGVVHLVQLGQDGDGPALEIPFEIRTADEGATLIVWPMVPLKPETRHAVLVTDMLKSPEGGCVSASPTMRALLDGASGLDPRLERMKPRYAEATTRTHLDPAQVVAATVFTTQSISHESEKIARDIAARQYTWAVRPTCDVQAQFRVCDGEFQAFDYRHDDVVDADAPPTPYTLAVRLWLPLVADEPFPLLIFGHGLGSDRTQGEALAEFAAPMGIATVALDAPSHGTHPTAQGDADIIRIAGFFGIDIPAQRLDALVLRDHWREATYDKLQLIELLLADGDLDGDTVSDFDTSHFAYLGVSLGGIMGAELMALSSNIGLGILSVPGGRVASIISDGPTFSVLVRAMTPPRTPPGEVARFFPVLQTLIERGDSANYGPHVLRDRFPDAGRRIPNLLFAMAIDDAIVPNVCNRSLARALGVPHIPPVLQDVGIVPVLDTAPVVGNFDEGRVTAGLFQFNRVVEREGEPVVKAEHDNLSKSTEGILQATHFLNTWIETGAAEIVDPYEVLGTSPLAQ